MRRVRIEERRHFHEGMVRLGPRRIFRSNAIPYGVFSLSVILYRVWQVSPTEVPVVLDRSILINGQED